MKILTIPATNSRDGINRRLLELVGRRLAALRPTVEVELLDLNDFEMPIYSGEREAAGIPAEARAFYDAIGAADAVIISYAEYNGSFTPAWKNTYDWASRVDQKVFQGTPVVMLAASPGPRAGAGVLAGATTTAPFFGAELVGSLGVGSFHQIHDPETGTLGDPEISARLDALLELLIAAVDDA